ncbi:MAG: histidine phosphatase family protein, partial [Micrococcaceae bacterium]|nr:histidine phosphatase family protein [Micrococcaceae bacterium]
SRQDTKLVYLARHGQTGLNAGGYIRGRANPPLDETGLAEARALAAFLATKQPVAVISSPLQRAVETARFVAQSVEVTPTIDERFNDRDYGQWTGRSEVEVIEQWGSIDMAPGVESASAVLSRVRPALDDVADAAVGPVVIVTHDAVIRPLIMALVPTITDLQEPTGCWNRLVRSNGLWTVRATGQKPETEPHDPSPR